MKVAMSDPQVFEVYNSYNFLYTYRLKNRAQGRQNGLMTFGIVLFLLWRAAKAPSIVRSPQATSVPTHETKMQWVAYVNMSMCTGVLYPKNFMNIPDQPIPLLSCVNVCVCVRVCVCVVVVVVGT